MVRYLVRYVPGERWVYITPSFAQSRRRRLQSMVIATIEFL